MWEVSDEEHKMNTIAEETTEQKHKRPRKKKQQQQERKDNPKSQHVESRC